MSKSVLCLTKRRKQIKSWHKLKRLLDSFKSNGYWFRGEKKDSELLPSIFLNSEENNYCSYDNEYDAYNILFDYVKNEDYIHVLEVARHYGLKCRFLDFSQDPLVALYFAIQRATNDDDPYIICFNVNNYIKHNKLEPYYNEENRNNKVFEMFQEYMEYGYVGSTDYDEYGNEIEYNFEYPIPIKCEKEDKRISSQKGAFLMWADIVGTDDLVQKEILEHSTVITIPPYLFKRIKHKLIKFGIEENSLFSDTDFFEENNIEGYSVGEESRNFFKQLIELLNVFITRENGYGEIKEFLKKIENIGGKCDEKVI